MYKNIKISNTKFFLCLFFSSLIISNFFINLFIILSSVFIFKKIRIRELFDNTTMWLAILYFVFIFLNSFIHDPINFKNMSIFRFLLIIILVFYLKNNYHNFENDLRKICLFFLLFVSFDLIFQNFYGYDIFGFEKDSDALSGPFRDEIAGSFLSKLWIFSGLYILNNSNFKFSLFNFIIVLSGIVLASERMALFHFLVISGIFFTVFILSNSKMVFKFITIIVLALVFFASLNVDKVKVQVIGKTLNQLGFNELSYKLINNSDMVNNYLVKKINSDESDESKASLKKLNNLILKSETKYPKSLKFAYYNWGFENNTVSSPHSKLYNSAKLIFLENFYLGTGVKTFQKKCELNLIIKNDPFNFQCSTHPHNIHIQILQETGIIGYIIFLLLMLNILYFSFKNFLLKKNFFELGYLIGLILLLLPLPSGNFFGTWPSSYFWFFVGLNIYSTGNLSIKKI